MQDKTSLANCLWLHIIVGYWESKERYIYASKFIILKIKIWFEQIQESQHAQSKDKYVIWNENIPKLLVDQE